MLLKSPLLTKVSILHDREVPLHAVKKNNNIMNNKTVAFSLSINVHITLIDISRSSRTFLVFNTFIQLFTPHMSMENCISVILKAINLKNC